MAGDYMIGTYDLATAFAGKLSAILMREYQKGRDFYDLQWYLSHSPRLPMNLAYLNANLAQQNQPAFGDGHKVISAVEKKVENLDIALLRSDMERFIIMDEKSFNEWLARYITDTLELLGNYKKHL